MPRLELFLLLVACLHRSSTQDGSKFYKLEVFPKRVKYMLIAMYIIPVCIAIKLAKKKALPRLLSKEFSSFVPQIFAFYFFPCCMQLLNGHKRVMLWESAKLDFMRCFAASA